jgi:hypothetical protein
MESFTGYTSFAKLRMSEFQAEARQSKAAKEARKGRKNETQFKTEKITNAGLMERAERLTSSL